MYHRFVIPVLCLIILLNNCGSDSEPKAEVELLSWKQDCDVIYKQPTGPVIDYIWGQVEIRYQIKNVGEVDIDYYKIWFAIQYASRPMHYEVAEGLCVPKGKLERKSIFVDFYADRKVLSVEVDDNEVGVF